MPGVSVSLSDRAYVEYANIHKTNRSRVISAALLEWASRKEDNLEGYVHVTVARKDLDAWHQFLETFKGVDEK